MAGKKDIVEQALKLIAGGVKEAGQSVAERAAKNIDVFNTAKRLGQDTNDISKLQETKQLMDYNKKLNSDINERVKLMVEAQRQLQEQGAFPMEIGTRFTTSKSREYGQLPWTITGYHVDAKDPYNRYGYRVRRESPNGGYEESNMMLRDPKLEALHGPEKWGEIQKDYIPLTGPKKADGGRIAKGPGGWLDDVVSMAGKLVAGEGEQAAKTGIRAYQGSPHDFAAERLVRFPDGRTEYIVGQPDVLPDVPQGAEVLQDFPLGRMRMDKIGTGEGAQAYGHGLYAAENEGVAKGYRDALSPKNYLLNAPETEIAQKYGQDVLDMFSSHSGDPNEIKNTINRLSEQNKRDLYDLGVSDVSQVKPQNNWGIEANLVNRADRLNRLQSLLASQDVKINPGHMYEVNIAADPNTFLDWDKPLSEQPEAVQRALSGIPLPRSDYGSYIWHGLVNKKNTEGAFGEHMADPMPAIKTGPKAAMEHLREAGIPGIKYLDAGSRVYDDTANGMIKNYGSREKALEVAQKRLLSSHYSDRAAWQKTVDALSVPETRNYVVFDDKLISIIRKYGIAGASAMLGYNLMENLDSKQALAATMADREYKESRPKQAEGGSVKDEDSWLDAAMTVARNAADKATFGTSKYAAAGADYLTDAALDALGYENDADFDRALAEQEYAMKEGEEKNPAAAGAGDIIGYVAPYLAVGPAEGALTTLGYLSDYGGKVGKTGSLFARALGFADGGEVPEQGYLESVGTAINQAANPVRRLIGVRTVDLPEGVDEVDYEELMNLAADVLDKSMLGFGGADPYAKRPKKFPVSPTGKIVDRVLPEEDDIDGALRIAKDVGGGLTPEEVGRRAAQDPATFDAIMQKYAIPDRDIAEYEALKSTVAKQPQDIQQMTHVGAPPMRDVKVDMPLFGGEYNIGSAPYNVAPGMAGVAQTAYDLKTLPMYAFGPTKPLAAGMDVAEGIATGDPTQAALAIAFGPGGKLARAAGIGASSYGMDPAEAQAGKERFFSKLLRTAEELPMEKMTGQQALAMLRKGTSPEELRWTGADVFLQNKPQITKDELVDYLSKNRISTTDIVRGGTKPTNRDDVITFDDDILQQYGPERDRLMNEFKAAGDRRRAATDPDEMARLQAEESRKYLDWFNFKDKMVDAQIEKMGGLGLPVRFGPGSKFGDRYSTPGGEDYRETLVSLPSEETVLRAWPVVGGDGLQHGRYSDFESAQMAANRIAGGTVLDPVETKVISGYYGPHWNEPNVVAHIRSQILTSTPEGANRPYKVFNVDEAQSDMAQEARKYGIKMSDDERKAIRDRIDKIREERAKYIGSTDLDERSKYDFLAKEEDDLLARYNQDYKKAVKDAPYIGSTQGWTDLSIKKSIDQALDSGADYFTFTPGDVQADRYSLARDLSHIEYEPNDDGTYLISAVNKDGKTVLENEFDYDDMEQHFGKEIADKIKSDAGRKMEDRPLRDWRILDNEQIKAKGDKMVDYYENIYKRRVLKVIKDATGKKVHWEKIPVNTAKGVEMRDGIRLDDLHDARFSDFNKGGRVTGGNSYGNDQSIANALALTREY